MPEELPVGVCSESGIEAWRELERTCDDGDLALELRLREVCVCNLKVCHDVKCAGSIENEWLILNRRRFLLEKRRCSPDIA